MIIINPFFIFDSGIQTIIGRIKMLAYIQASILAPIAVWLILQYRKKLMIYTVAATIPLVITSATAPLPFGMQPDYLAEREWLLQNLSENRKELQNIPIIIAPHGEQFLVTYILNVVSQQRPPTETHYNPVYWLIHDINGRNIDGVATRLEGGFGDYGTVIIEEKALYNYLKSVDSATYRSLVRSNDHLRKFQNSLE